MTCLVISGSLPPNTSRASWPRSCQPRQGQGAEFVLDISSHQLADLIAMEPLLIKPNDDELLDIFGIKVSGWRRRVRQGRDGRAACQRAPRTCC